MPFHARFVAPFRNPPARGYLHSSGFEIYNDICGARDYFVETLEAVSISFSEEPKYIIATMWGNLEENKKIADVFAYHGIKKWSDNPEISAITVINGKPQISNPITCGESMMVLGEEERFRRTTNNLQEYMEKVPIITGIKFETDSIKIVE